MDDDQFLEGWCTDPFGRHEARWMSQGHPTKLVRDGEVEGHDPPPDEEPTVTPQLIEGDHDADRGGADLLRADATEHDPRSMRDRAANAAAIYFPPGP